MLLTSLISQAGLKPLQNLPTDQSVQRVCLDSRNVQPGDLFVAVSCDAVQKHIQQALNFGAKYIVAEPAICNALSEATPSLICLSTPNPRLTGAKLAALCYPDQPKTTVAVTGTNGKSSTVTFLRQLWGKNGLPAASLGTLGLECTSLIPFPNDLKLPSLTTPDPIPLHQALNSIAQSGITHLGMEATSLGLHQYRLHGVRLSAAGFTNLSQDHLDYHLSMDQYFAAKTQLFSEVLPEGSPAVVNLQTPYFHSLREIIKKRHQSLVTFAVNQEADISAANLTPTSDGLRFSLTIQEKKWSDIQLAIVGTFQAENILCAIGLALVTGIPAERIVEALPSLRSARGRMEYVGSTPQNGHIYIDYAHTPDALERALISLRAHLSGKIIVVFGCGGNRDTSKRPLMGNIAERFADQVFVTDDNPRHEDPAKIRAQILSACPKAIEIKDRRQAIHDAICMMKQQDILLIAGKGHEQGQIIGNTILPFDDRQEALNILHHL